MAAPSRFHHLADTLFITPLQGDAWAAWNQSYHAEDRDLYRHVSRDLYSQDVHERVSALLSRSDEQNALLDALLHEQEVHDCLDAA